jgi:energy-coupling factor transporter ATP-binding protein EcfA2
MTAQDMSQSTTQAMPNGELLLRLRGISKQFGAVTALSDIELDVHAGEVVALVGDNGAGKSTLVKILAGVYQPSAGTIEYGGEQITLCRLRYGGSAHTWGFAIYRASHDDYEDNFLPSGSPTGSAEEALDCACGLYLNDPTASRADPSPTN